MALRLDIQGIKKAKDTIMKMGGIVPVADYQFTYKGYPIHCLAVVMEGGYPTLKFRYYYNKEFYKDLHPKTKEINDIVKIFNENYR